MTSSANKTSDEWLCNLGKMLPRYFNSKCFGGKCTIVLSDCVIECSKTILSAQSPVLDLYFRERSSVESGREKRMNKEYEIDLTGQHNLQDFSFLDDADDEDDSTVLILTEYYGYDDVVKEFFKSFYSGLIDISPPTYRITFKLACQYEVKWIVKQCSEFLGTHLKASNFITECKFLLGLEQDCITKKMLFLLEGMRYFDLFRSHDIPSEWFTLSFDQLISIMPHLRSSSELFIFNLAFQWLEYDPTRKIHFEKLLSNIGIVNLPIKFVCDFVLKHIEGMYEETANLYKMIMTAQNHCFMKRTGITKPPKKSYPFPKIFYTRPSLRNTEEYEFSIQKEDLFSKKNAFADSVVTLKLDKNDISKSRFVFSKPCCFVYIITPELVMHHSIRKLLIPVQVVKEKFNFQSHDIKIFGEIIAKSIPENIKSLTKIDFVACIFTA